MDKLQTLPVEKVQESPTNPRKYFDAQAQAELEASVKELGIITPIIVRSINSHFEIVSGHRRFRAAQKVGLKEVPVLIREFDGTKAEEVAIVDNLLRADVHPLDECAGYQYLIEEKKYDPLTIAIKTSKPLPYIVQRLALSALTAQAIKLFREEKITIGHALLLARMTPADQKTVLDVLNMRKFSVPEFRNYIEQTMMRDLNKFPFDKKDATLISGVPACVGCSKRSGANAELFSDITPKDICTDLKCAQAKRDVFMKRQEKALKEKKTTYKRLTALTYEPPEGCLTTNKFVPAKDTCPTALLGIWQDGPMMGHTLRVCTTAGCPVCDPRREAPLSVKSQSPADREKRKKEIRVNRIEQGTRTKMLHNILAKVENKSWTRLMLNTVLENVWFPKEYDAAMLKAIDVPYNKGRIMKEAKDNQVMKMIVLSMLHPTVFYDALQSPPKATALYDMFAEYKAGDTKVLRDAATQEHDGPREEKKK